MAKHYDKQFKLDAIQYYNDHKELGVAGCANNLGISQQTLSRWKKLTYVVLNKSDTILTFSKNSLSFQNCFSFVRYHVPLLTIKIWLCAFSSVEPELLQQLIPKYHYASF